LPQSPVSASHSQLHYGRGLGLLSALERGDGKRAAMLLRMVLQSAKVSTVAAAEDSAETW